MILSSKAPKKGADKTRVVKRNVGGKKIKKK